MRVGTALIALISLSGCSIHPTTEDFSRELVPDIIRKVKCEARDAVLATVPNDPQFYLMDTGVAFAFDFIMSEANDAGSTGTFGIPVPNGSVAISFGLSDSKDRKTTQRVTIADTFGDLAKMTTCDGTVPNENFRYPITGTIGLLATFENYRSLMNDHVGNSLMGSFEDELSFTTDLGASLSSRVRLTAVSTKSLDVTGGAEVARSDLHRVKLTFTPVPNSYQRAEKAKLDKKKRMAELKKIAQEKAIPTVVRIEDGKSVVIPPKAENGRHPPSNPPTVSSPAARRPSNYEIKEEALRALERSDSRAFQDSFRREFEER